MSTWVIMVIGTYSQRIFVKNAQKQYDEFVNFVIFEDSQKGLPVVL